MLRRSCIVALVSAIASCGTSSSSTPAPVADTAPQVDAAPDAPITCPGVSLNTDPRNCGACGHDCLDGGCNNGRCLPFVFADGLVTPIAVTVTADAVFLAESRNRVTRIDRATREKSTFASDQKYPLFISTVGGPLAWSNAGEVVSSGGATIEFVDGTGSIAYGTGSATKLLAEALNSPAGAVLSADSVFWGDLDGLHAIGTDGAGRRTLTTTVPYALTADDSSIYFTSYNLGTVRAVPKSGGTTRLIASKQTGPSWIAVDAEYAYWASFSTVADAGGVYRAPKAGGGAAEKIGAGTRAYALALDDQWVYVADLTDGVSAVKKDGSDMRLLTNDPAGSIGADEKMVFWTRSSAGVLNACVK